MTPWLRQLQGKGVPYPQQTPSIGVTNLRKTTRKEGRAKLVPNQLNPREEEVLRNGQCTHVRWKTLLQAPTHASRNDTAKCVPFGSSTPARQRRSECTTHGDSINTPLSHPTTTLNPNNARPSQHGANAPPRLIITITSSTPTYDKYRNADLNTRFQSHPYGTGDVSCSEGHTRACLMSG